MSWLQKLCEPLKSKGKCQSLKESLCRPFDKMTFKKLFFILFLKNIFNKLWDSSSVQYNLRSNEWIQRVKFILTYENICIYLWGVKLLIPGENQSERTHQKQQASFLSRNVYEAQNQV